MKNNGDHKLPRTVMNAVSDPRDVSEHKYVYSAIKWLEHSNIIARKDIGEGDVLVKGSKWDSFNEDSGSIRTD
jgi:hypothetical protein